MFKCTQSAVHRRKFLFWKSVDRLILSSIRIGPDRAYPLHFTLGQLLLQLLCVFETKMMEDQIDGRTSSSVWWHGFFFFFGPILWNYQISAFNFILLLLLVTLGNKCQKYHRIQYHAHLAKRYASFGTNTKFALIATGFEQFYEFQSTSYPWTLQDIGRTISNFSMGVFAIYFNSYVQDFGIFLQWWQKLRIWAETFYLWRL